MASVRGRMSSPGRILLVEDDEALRGVLAEVLADEGYDVLCASNGKEALDRLARSHADLILLDLVMPVMDGWAFRDAQRLDAHLANIPTVVLSASYPPDSARIRALEAEEVLSKPVSMEHLILALRRVLPDSRPHRLQ